MERAVCLKMVLETIRVTSVIKEISKGFHEGTSFWTFHDFMPFKTIHKAYMSVFAATSTHNVCFTTNNKNVQCLASKVKMQFYPHVEICKLLPEWKEST